MRTILTFLGGLAVGILAVTGIQALTDETDDNYLILCESQEDDTDNTGEQENQATTKPQEA